MPPRSEVWSKPLSQAITLRNGKKLKTLADARGVLIEQFQTVLKDAA